MDEISTRNFLVKANEIWNSAWFLLTCGDFKTNHFNCMTVSWGGFGTLWNLPIAMVVVRPSRFTFEFINQYNDFSLCAFPGQYRKALNLLGSQSGRDGDKIAASGLTPMAAGEISSPVYREADLMLECRKLYWQDIDPENFIDKNILEHYPEEDFHRMFLGEIMAIQGEIGKYSSN